MKKKLTKAKLVSEIADTTNLSKKKVADVLNSLTKISYREAGNGFIVPGICKLSVVRRKERRCRIPSTGQLILIGEHDALKVTPIGSAKNAVAPKSKRTLTVVDEIPKKKQSPEVNNKPENTTPSAIQKEPPPSSQDNVETEPDSGGSIVFACPECGSMISAPSDSAGKNAECPFCNVEVKIPLNNADKSNNQESSSGDDTNESVQSGGFMTFFCNECGQEIESAKSMAGLTASCPTCGSQIDIPDSSMPPPTSPDNSQGSSSMTMRIDLMDLE